MMNESQLNEILSGFTGDVKKDIDYFLSVREKYRNRTSVWYYDENAITHSVVSDTVLDEAGGPARILCIYDNNPIVNNDKGIRRHIGVMELFVLADENSIRGTYFNNPVQKKTYGEINITLVSRNRLKVFKQT